MSLIYHERQVITQPQKSDQHQEKITVWTSHVLFHLYSSPSFTILIASAIQTLKLPSHIENSLLGTLRHSALMYNSSNMPARLAPRGTQLPTKLWLSGYQIFLSVPAVQKSSKNPLLVSPGERELETHSETSAQQILHIIFTYKKGITMKKSHQHEHDSWSMVENRANSSTGLNSPEKGKSTRNALLSGRQGANSSCLENIA